MTLAPSCAASSSLANVLSFCLMGSDATSISFRGTTFNAKEAFQLRLTRLRFNKTMCDVWSISGQQRGSNSLPLSPLHKSLKYMSW